MGRARKAAPSGMPGSTGDAHAPPAGQRKGTKRAPAAGQQQQQPQLSSQQGEASLPSPLVGQQQHVDNAAAADTRRGSARPRGASRPPVKRARKEAQPQQGPKVKGGDGSPTVSNGTGGGAVKGSGAKAGPGPLPVDNGGGRPATEGPDATQKKPRRQSELWSAEDKNVFFQSLYEHGKDFEAIQNDIAKYYLKKGQPAGAVKNKEQVRYFYYRTWHSISKHIDFENVFCRGMEKSSQELYGLICYGELRKKIGGCVNDRNSVKLNELIQLGVTTLRHSGRKLRIKAPMCRALKKICDPYGTSGDKEQKRIKLPTKVCVELQPRTNHAWTRVQSVAHNPRLRMMVELHRKVSHLIEFLKEKWTPKETRVRLSLLQQQQQQEQKLEQQQSSEAETPLTLSSTATLSSAVTTSSTVTSSLSTTTSSLTAATSPSVTTFSSSTTMPSSSAVMSSSSTVMSSSSTAVSLASAVMSSPSEAMSLSLMETSLSSAATSSPSAVTSSSLLEMSSSSNVMSLPSTTTSFPLTAVSSPSREMSSPSPVTSSPSPVTSSPSTVMSSSSSTSASSSSTMAPSTVRSSSSSTVRSSSLTTRSSSLTTRSSSSTARSTARSSCSTARSSSSKSTAAAVTSEVVGCPPLTDLAAVPDERPQLRLFPPAGAVVSPLPCAARVRHSRTMCTVHWQEQSRGREAYVPPQAQLMRARPQLLASSVPPLAASVAVSAPIAKEGPVPGPVGTSGKGQRGSRSGATGQEVARVREVAMAEPAGPCLEKNVSGTMEVAPVEPSDSPVQPAETTTEVCDKDASGGQAAPSDSADSEPDVSSTEPEPEPKLEASTRSELVLSPVANYEEYSLLDPVPRYLKSCRSLVIPSDEDEQVAPAELASDRLPGEEGSARDSACADVVPAPLAAAVIFNGVEEPLLGVANGSAENGADAVAGGHSPKPASPTEANVSVMAAATQALESGVAVTAEKTGKEATSSDYGKKDCGTPAATLTVERKQPLEPRGGGKRGAEAVRACCSPYPCNEDSAAFAERVWREGWGGSKTLTLAEVYVTLGKPEKLLLEYDWIIPPPPAKAAKPAPTDEAQAPEDAAATAAAAAGGGAEPGATAKTEAVAATETGLTTEAGEVKEQPPVVHMQRMLRQLLQLVVLEANPKVQRVQSPDGLNSSPSKAGGVEAGGGGGAGGTGGNTRSPGSARTHPGRGARGSGGGSGGARNVTKPAAAAASGPEPDAAKTAGRSDDDLFRVPSALPPSSRHGRPMSPSKEADIAFRQQLDSINQAEIFLPQHRKLRTRMLRKPLVVQRSLMPRPTGHAMRHMYSLAIVPSSSVAGTGMFSPLLPPAHSPNNPKASSLSTAIDLAAKSAGIIPGSPIREGLNEVTDASVSSAALPCPGGESTGRYGAQSDGTELPGGQQETGTSGSRRVPFITLSTPTEGHSISSSGPCMDFVDDADTLATVGPPPVSHVERPPLLPSPPHVPLLLEISLPGPPEDSLSQGGPHSHIGDSIIELAIGSQRYMPGEGKLNGVDGDKPPPSPRNWMGSPPHEPQWFGSDVTDVCLGSLLSNFSSLDKSQRTMQLMGHSTVTPELGTPSLLEGNVHDSYAPRPLVSETDSPLASIICESGVDYIARFSDLAKEVSNSEQFTAMHCDPGLERRDAPTGLPAQSTPR